MADQKKLLCSDPNCDKVVAHQITDKTFELRRLNQSVTMTGENFSGMATCPENPDHPQTSIVVTGGKLDTSAIRFKDESGDGDD